MIGIKEFKDSIRFFSDAELQRQLISFSDPITEYDPEALEIRGIIQDEIEMRKIESHV